MALSTLAEKSNLSMAWVGRKAILDFLDRYSDKQIPLAFSEADKRGDDGFH